LLASLPASINADLVVVPALGEASEGEYVDLAIAMADAAATIGGLALLDPPTAVVQQVAANPTTYGSLLADLADQIRAAATSPANAAIFSSPLVGPSPYGTTPASVAVAAVIARTDALIGTWGQPAGMRAELPARPLLEPSLELTGFLSGSGVNVLMLQHDTPVVWGARTLSTEIPGRYIATTRTLATIHKTIQHGLQSYVFAPNDGETWLAVIRSISNYLMTLYNEGGLLGEIASDAFTVNVGLGSTMDADDLLNGLMRVTVAVAVAEPGVFVQQNFVLDMQ
jgi:phage tail sheath protein FI